MKCKGRESKEGGKGGEDDNSQRIKTNGHEIAYENGVSCVDKLNDNQTSD